MTHAMRIESMVMPGIRALVCAAMLIGTGGLQRAHAEDAKVPSYIGMTKINVSDIDRSTAFYTNVMGLKVSHVLEIGGGKIKEVLLTRSGGDYEQTLVLNYDSTRKEPRTHGNSFGALVFVIDDFKDRVQRLKAEGYKITAMAERQSFPTFFVPFISYAFFKDPDGNTVELNQFHKN